MIPARAGSKGLRDKNVRPLGDSSLLTMALQTAQAVGGGIIVTTDYPASMLPTGYPWIYHRRHADLCGDFTPMSAVLRDVVETYQMGDEDEVVLVQPTSLHRHRADLILAALSSHLPAISVDRVPDRWHPWYCLDPNVGCYAPPQARQGLPLRYRPNGLFYAMTGYHARWGNWWTCRPTFVETPGVINIDTPADWAEAERVYG